MDRANAIRLLEALMAGGKYSGKPIATAWIHKKAWEIGLEGQNLFSAIYKQEMQQHIGMMGRAWYTTGPRYTAQATYSF